MTTDNLEELLEVTFEMEGLITLMIKREDMTPDKIYDMLKRKAAKFNDLLGLETAVEEKKSPVLPVREAAPEVSDENPEAEVKEITPEEPAADTVEIEQENDAEIAAAAEYEEEEDAVPETPAAVNPVAEAPAESLLNDVLAKKMPSFTLNDKFRFRRSLFNNSDEEFDGTMKIISEMKSMEEVEDYLYNDLCFEPENEDVKAFVEIIAPLFT